jgi:hypothetical protein
MIVFFVSLFGKKTVRLKDALLDNTLARDSSDLRRYRDVMQRPDNVLLAARIAALNRLLDEKAFSWTLLMRDLAGLIPSQVQISTMQPVRAKDGQLAVQMHIIGPRMHVLEFLEHLEGSPSFGYPRLVRESAQDASSGTNNAIGLSDAVTEEFEIEAEYVPNQSTGPEPKGDSRSEPHSAMLSLPSGPTKKPDPPSVVHGPEAGRPLQGGNGK